MEFVAGLVFGAILGVLADRIWERWESRPRVSIQPGFYCSLEGSGHSLTVMNVGVKEIADYDLQLFHPGRGTLIAFRTTGVGPLLPGQQREHRCPMIDIDPSRPYFRIWFFTVKHKPIANPTFEDFRFRLRMKNSDVVLFESKEIGNALARLWVKLLQTGDPLCGNGEDLTGLHYPKRSRLRRWLDDRRAMRRLKSGDSSSKGEV